MTSSFASIEVALAALKAGQMVILMDDEDRENEGDLIMAAEHAGPEQINFMTQYGRGLICLPMAEALIDKLGLPLMVTHNRSPYGTAFTVSIEARVGVSTGISAKDRAKTIQVAIDAETGPSDLISPGHIFPLRARAGGVLERPGQTEGSIDLMKLAGLKPAAVICEILNPDGSMSRLKELIPFAKTHGLPLISIQALIDYRVRYETLVEELVSTTIPLHKHGNFAMKVFRNDLDSAEHFALIKESVDKTLPPLVRIHSECITGDVLGSCKCDCGEQLDRSLELIAEQGGVLVYLRQEGRGIGLANKLKAYNLQAQGYDTVEANLALGFPADNRNYAVAYQILKHLHIQNLRILTNNPLKMQALENYGLKIEARLDLNIRPGVENQSYLKTKQEKLGHLLNLEPLA